MIFFNRLFAAYYNLLIKQRKIKLIRHLNRGGTEDFGAMCFVLYTQMIILVALFVLTKKIVGLSFSFLQNGVSTFFKLLIIMTLVIWVYIGNKYYLSNRLRRNQFLDDFNNLSAERKKLWYGIGIFFLIIPFLLILYITVEH